MRGGHFGRLERSRRAWIPRDLGGCTLFLRGDDNVDGAVVTWPDESTAAHVVTQATGSAQGSASTKAAFANKKAVSLTPAKYYPTGVTLGASTTIVYVGTRSSTASAYLLLIGSQATGGLTSNFTDTGFQFYNGSDFPTTGAIASTTAPQVLVVTQVDATSFVGRLNGTQKWSSVPAAALSGKALSIGDTQLHANGGTFDLGELAVFNRLLSAAEIGLVERCAGARYGVAIA